MALMAGSLFLLFQQNSGTLTFLIDVVSGPDRKETSHPIKGYCFVSVMSEHCNFYRLSPIGNRPFPYFSVML